MRGVFITGSGTGVGKTIVAAFVARSFAREGLDVRVFKPAVTGLDESGEPDHVLLRRAANSSQSDEQIAPYRFGPSASPHLAAEMAGEEIEQEHLLKTFEAATIGADAIVCEGVGGLLVPLNLNYQVRDLMLDLGMPVAIASAPGLGAINHTLLTIEAAKQVGLEVSTVVLSPWPEKPSAVEESNRKTIAAFGAVDVAVLPRLDLDDPEGWPENWTILGPNRG